MGTLAGIDADVWAAASPSVALAAPEACDNTDSGVWKKYKTHTHRYWDKRVAVVVQTSATGSGGWSTVTSGYTWQPIGGVIEFAVALTDHFVQVLTGNYFNVSQCADCYEWSLDMKANSTDTSVFQGDGWGAFTGTNKVASGKFGTFQVDDALITELANLLIFSLYVDKSVGTRWECAGYLVGDSFKAASNGVISQDISFTADGDVVFYATSSLP